MIKSRGTGLDVRLAASLAALLLALAALGERARQRFAQDLTAEVFANRMVELLNALCAVQNRDAALSAGS